MLIIVLVCVIVIFWILYDHFSRLLHQRSSLKIPGPGFRAYPLIGHAYAFIGSSEDRMTTFSCMGDASNKNGGLCGQWFGRVFYLVVSEPEYIELINKTFLEKDDTMNILQYMTGNGSIFAPVHIWRPRRKLIAPAFQPKILKNFIQVFSAESKELVSQLQQVADKKPFSIFNYMINYTMDSICITNFGIKVSSQKSHSFIDGLDSVVRILGAKVCQPWLQIDFIYKYLPQSKHLRQSRHKVRHFIEQVIASKKTEKEEEIKNTSEADRDYDIQLPNFDTFLNVMMEQNRSAGGPLTDADLRDECVVMCIAGTDTSALGTSFTLSVLAKYPDVQEKVYQELKEVFGDSDRPLVSEDLVKLRYLEAVLKETLRLYPPVPVVVRKIDKYFTIKPGITIAPGAGCLINIWATHRNPKYWGADAEVFRPERFLDLNLAHPAAFIPFSYGPRNCIGFQFAMYSIKTALASILREFRMLPPDDRSSDVKTLRVKFDVMMKDVDNFVLKMQSRRPLKRCD